MEQQKSTRIPRKVVALGFVSLFTDAANEMIYPLVPIFVSLLGSAGTEPYRPNALFPGCCTDHISYPLLLAASVLY